MVYTYETVITVPSDQYLQRSMSLKGSINLEFVGILGYTIVQNDDI